MKCKFQISPISPLPPPSAPLQTGVNTYQTKLKPFVNWTSLRNQPMWAKNNNSVLKTESHVPYPHPSTPLPLISFPQPHYTPHLQTETGGQYSLSGPYWQTLLIALNKKVVVPRPLKNLQGNMVKLLCSYALLIKMSKIFVTVILKFIRLYVFWSFFYS